MHARIIGIDLGVTAAHQAVILDSASGTFLGGVQTLHPQPAALQRLLQRACAGGYSPADVAVVLEATGMAWHPVSLYLHAQGATVYRINGRQTRDLRRALQRYAGSDRIDCRVLTQLYQIAHTQWVPWQPPSGAQLTLQRLCREYVRLREADIAIQNRLTAYDQWAWGGLAHLSAAARDWVREYWYDPWQVSAAGEAQLRAAWQAVAPAEESDATWITAWVTRAAERQTLYLRAENVDYAGLAASVKRELEARRALLAAQEELFALHIRPLYRQLYPERWLESLYGIGEASAAIYMAFIQDIARFPTVAQFRAWCGIIPYSHQSGTHEAKHAPLTQAGPDEIKATLYLNAEVARQWDPQLAVVYYRQMVEYGKHHTQAVCAVASHLANRIYAVLKTERAYELRDVSGTPLTPAAAREICRTRYHVPEEVRERNAVRARKARTAAQVEAHYTRQLPA